MKINIKNLVIASVLTAIGIMLPSVFHMFSISGMIFLPMHFPVLLCGLVCGWRYGGICGVIVPLMCSLLTGMPVLYPTAIAMALELCAYGVIGGIMRDKFNIYASLITAMIGGRIINGIANAVLLGLLGNGYALKTFVMGAFVTPIPGIIVQIIVIPSLAFALYKARLADLTKQSFSYKLKRVSE